MQSHLSMLKSINSFVVVIALVVIGFSGYVANVARGHADFAYVTMCLGIFMEVIACCGLLGAKFESVKVLVMYFWILFILIALQVITFVLACFRKDEAFDFVTSNADKLELTNEDDVKALVSLMENNLQFLAVCLLLLIFVQSVAAVLASMHFKRACLIGLTSISRVGGQALFWVGVGVHVGSSATETAFAHATFFGYMLMFVGVYQFLLGSVGLQGVKRESSGIIGCYFWLMLFTLLAEITGGCLIMFKREQTMALLRTQMSDRTVSYSEKEIDASMDLLKQHLQITAIAAFLLCFQQALAVILSLTLRSELRGGDGMDLKMADLIDRELFDVIPGAARQGTDILKDYVQPRKWTDTYENMRRKYDDFDDFR